MVAEVWKVARVQVQVRGELGCPWTGAEELELIKLPKKAQTDRIQSVNNVNDAQQDAAHEKVDTTYEEGFKGTYMGLQDLWAHNVNDQRCDVKRGKAYWGIQTAFLQSVWILFETLL